MKRILCSALALVLAWLVPPAAAAALAIGLALALYAAVLRRIGGDALPWYALTIALAVDGSFDWAMVPGYIIAQFAGAFVGAVIVYLMFKDQFDATDDPNIKRGVFCTSPSVPNRFRNFLSEIVGTFVLVFTILGLNQVPNMPGGVNYILVFGIIVSIVLIVLFIFLLVRPYKESTTLSDRAVKVK